MSIKVSLVLSLRHFDAYLIWKLFGTSLLSSNIIWQHDFDLETETTLGEDDVLDCMINIIVLWLTSGDEVSLFVFLNLGSLLSELSGDNHLASLNVLNLHDISDDEHGSRPDGGLLHDLSLKKFSLSVGGEGLVENEVKLENDIPCWESVSLGEELFILVGFVSVMSDGRLSVDDFDDDC